ncbi:MAG: Mth938-like domain-containing protein [Defluviicoccus sp.]|nr:Mth938-like domain-containing protein [Defluviicoccus sp.]MDE0383508.1 Mth938-like domain-containing protein [Defluviicoccus sp.]
MTEIASVDPQGRSVIQSYGDGRFRISGTTFEGSVIVLVDAVLPWPGGDAGEVSLGDFAPVVDADPAVEILLIGTGNAMRPLDRELAAALKVRGIVADAMDTGAACRTFNVLAGEERRVAAALSATG